MREQKDYQILLASIFFAGSSFFRLNGIIAFPIEIGIIIGFFVIKRIWRKKKISQRENQSGLFQLQIKKIIKTSILISIPWIVFIMVYLGYFAYYTGDPFTTYLSYEGQERWYDTSPSSILNFEGKDFENIKQFSQYLLPYQFPAVYDRIDENYESVLGGNWLGMISLVILSGICFLSLYTKNQRVIIFTFLILIVSTVWLLSTITLEERASYGIGVPPRYMIPFFILSSMMFGYLITSILKVEAHETSRLNKNLIKGLKIGFAGILVIFFIGAFYFSPPIQMLTDDKEFKNPITYVERYPVNSEGLVQNNVLLSRLDENGIN